MLVMQGCVQPKVRQGLILLLDRFSYLGKTSLKRQDLKRIESEQITKTHKLCTRSQLCGLKTCNSKSY